MVQKSRQVIKHFFQILLPAKVSLVRSCGLFFLLGHMHECGIANLLKNILNDHRQSSKIKYKINLVIMSILLHILDGDLRISQYGRNPNGALYQKLFDNGKIPHPTTYLETLKNNPTLSRMLGEVLFQSTMQEVISACLKKRLSHIIIDVDQTARVIHGKQQKVEKGYAAGKRNEKLYQVRVYAIHSLKLVLGIRLLPGSAHSGNGFTTELKLIINALKKAGITALFRGDSGFESGEACDTIHEAGHWFIFAERQLSVVRKRGSKVKRKQLKMENTVELREAVRNPGGRYEHKYREIFVRVASTPDGQLLFDFGRDQFTNVLITNMKSAPITVYKNYRAHAVIETIIEELKNDFGAGLAHAAEFHVNASMTVCSALAYNIKNHFVQHHRITVHNEKVMKLSTLQALWIHTPGILARNGNIKVLRIAKERYALFRKIAA